MVKKIGLFLIIPLMLCLVATQAYCADEAVLGNSRWKVTNEGDLVPIDDSSYDIGANGSEISEMFIDSLVIGGDTITGASQVSSPMESQGSYVRIQGNDNVKLFTNGNLTITGDADADSYIMENDAQLDNAANGTVTLTEASSVLSFAFDGTDVSLDVDTGGLTLTLTDGTNGTFDVKTNNVTTDYLIFSQGVNQSTITATGTGNDLYLVAAGGDINCADEDITTTGTITAGTLSAGAIGGFDTLTGSTHGDTISLATDDTLVFYSDNGDNATVIQVLGYSGKDARLKLSADNAEDAGDEWFIDVDETDNLLGFWNETTELIDFDTSGNIDMVTGTTFAMGNDETIKNNTDDTIQIASNDTHTILEVYSPLTSSGTATLGLSSDGSEDAGDRWQVQADGSENLVMKNDTSTVDVFVTKFTVAGADGDITTTGDVEVVDDMDLVIGSTSATQWKAQMDQGVDQQLLFITAGTTAAADTDPMFEILTGTSMDADQQVFGVAKGTQVTNTALFTVDEDGDVIVTGDVTITGNGLNSAGDLLITPTGTEVHIDGGLSIGDTTAVGDNNFNVVGASTFNGAIEVIGTTPIINLGDGGNEDNTLLFDGQSTKDFYAATDNADDSWIFGYGSTVGTDSRITIQDSADATLIEIGDGQAFDTMIVFDGNTTDMYIGIDDAGVYPDDLVIGVGSTMATTAGIVMAKTTADVTIISDFAVQGGDITFSSATASEPVLTFSSTVAASTSNSTVYDHTRGGTAAVDGDDLHTDIYSAYDDAGTPAVDTYVTVLYEITDSAAAAEDGNVTWTVVSGGADVNFLELDGEAGVQINAGSIDINTTIGTANDTSFFVIDGGNSALTLTSTQTAGLLDIVADAVTTDGAVTISVDALTSGDGLNISSSSTAGNVYYLAHFTSSGANGTADKTRNGLLVAMSGTGDTSLNIAGQFDATGATTNVALSTLRGAVNFGNGTYDAGDITMIKGTQTGDPQVILGLSADSIGDFSITTDSGDITLTAADDIFLVASGDIVQTTLTAAGKLLIEGDTTRLTAVEVLDIDATFDTTTATDDVDIVTIVGARAAADTGGTHGITASITTGNMANGETTYLYGGSYDSQLADTATSVATVFYAKTSTVSSNSCTDTAFLAATGYDVALQVYDDVVLGSSTDDANLILHDASTITLYEDGDNFSASLACTDGAAEFTFNDDVNVGGSGDAENLAVHNAGIQYWYEGGDTFEVNLACNDGEAVGTLTGGLDITGVLTIKGNSLNSDGDLLITPAGGQVHIDGGLDVGGTSAVPDNSIFVGGTSQLAAFATVTDTTNARVVSSSDYGKTLFFTFAGDVTVTLPANGATAGSWVRFMNANSDTTDVLINAATANTLITFNNDAADGVEFGSGHRISSTVICISNGSFWVAINENGACTMTVVDA